MKVNKRFRKPTPKAGELLVQYGKIDGDVGLQYCWPENTCGMKRDTRILMWAVEQEPIFEGKTLRELLIERGYDITTFRLSVRKLPDELVVQQ